MTNEEFKRTLWEAADKLRGSVWAAEYKYPLLSPVFLKYVLGMYDAQAQATGHRMAEPGSELAEQMGKAVVLDAKIAASPGALGYPLLKKEGAYA
ncbi:MAG TPA: type I restriction-modification system subunit M N-terminal domain-containing protein [Dyella sp.]|uniref:type I restriction-modification system subunit M N-terminal domain-containing protein n=1 Tax=Dyella sp. TaxID=1869338 RepID=UPI002C89B807|nr:type I restriction-modification system subunit M N-terminal domain-containing protein [Dyella sp.]HTV84244.1 type I restriction-modification system subunit M N-terminal domain-containing protein [Dyella sp.]